MYKVILILDKFFLKYEVLQKKLPSKSPALLGLKSEIDKLDVGKLKTTQVDLNKLSDATKNEVMVQVW